MRSLSLYRWISRFYTYHIKFKFPPQQKKKLKELIKMEKKLQKPYTRDYTLLLVQDLRQAHYQTLIIILLNAKMDKMIKKFKMCGLK